VIKVEDYRQQQEQVQEQRQLLSEATRTAAAAAANVPLTETSAAAPAGISGRATMESTTASKLLPPPVLAVAAATGADGAAEGVLTFGGSGEPLCTSGEIDAWIIRTQLPLCQSFEAVNEAHRL
jgi:hypothetical protein